MVKRCVKSRLIFYLIPTTLIVLPIIAVNSELTKRLDDLETGQDSQRRKENLERTSIRQLTMNKKGTINENKALVYTTDKIMIM